MLMDDERMEGAVDQGAHDDKQDDQGGDGLAGIARHLTLFDGDSGVGGVVPGSYIDSWCASWV